MHELGIIQNVFRIIEEVAAEHHLIKVHHVKLKLGKLQQIVPEILTFAFEAAAKGTNIEGATLQVEEVPITMVCNGCEREFVVENQMYICPECSGTHLTMQTGMEIILESLEGEQDPSKTPQPWK